MDKKIIQVTSGRGPVECCRVVAKLLALLIQQARKEGLVVEVLRKNWFAGIASFDVQQQLQWNEKEVRFETCRASGTGGQHVNKVETAVRGTHLPSGIRVLAMDSRSQLENKQHCRERLQAKVMAWQAEQLVEQQQTQWQNHNILERGNPVKVINATLL